MRNLLFPLLLLLFAAQPLRAGDDGKVYQRLLESKSPAIVTIKYVVKIEMAFGGMTQDQESRGEIRGIVVDESGLILTSSAPLSTEMSRDFGQGDFTLKVTGSQFKVLFHDGEDDEEEKEYEAILAALDSKLGLGFLQVTDLGDRKPMTLALGEAGGLEVGAEFIGVTRFAKGFDYAPHFGTATITGEVNVPRHMWCFSGDFQEVGLPIFDPAGNAVGILVSQESAMESEGGGMMGLFGGLGGRSFILPIRDFEPILENARNAAIDALKRAAEQKEKADEEGEKKEEKKEGEKEGEEEEEKE